MKRTIFLILFCWMLFGLSELACAEPLDTLRVGYVDRPGYLTMDASGRYSGYAYEYMETLASYGNWQAEYVPGTREECSRWLNEGKIDVICGMWKSQYFEQYLDYTDALFAMDVLELAQGGGHLADSREDVSYRLLLSAA